MTTPTGFPPTRAKAKPWVKFLPFFLLIVGGGIWATKQGYLKPAGVTAAAVIKTDATVGEIRETSNGSVAKLPIPSSDAVNLSGATLKLETWAWNSQIGALYAIGGPTTTKGSLFAKYGIPATVVRQDNTDQMASDLASYAKSYAAGNKNPRDGVNAVLIMGSQAGGFLQGLNSTLSDVGDEAIIVTVVGRSDGEDAIMGPRSWKDGCKNAIGKAIAVSIYEGDADIIKKWTRDGDCAFNPDPTTFDPNAVNIIAANDYVDAADKFVSGYCDPSRALVRNGVRTGKTQKVCVDGISTWTPADVKAAKGRGGIVRIVSTHEYKGIMPNTLIVLRKWAEDNRPTMVNIIKAFGEGGDQVLNNPDALRRGCEISTRIYKEQNADFWCNYYRGTVEADATNQQVQLGGSRAANLADASRWFGLTPGAEFVAGRTYTTFGKMIVENYPTKFKAFPPVEKAFDKSFLQDAIQGTTSPTAAADVQKFNPAASGSTIATKAWHITFPFGSAEITPAAEQLLNDLLNDLVLSQGTAVEVNGNTDNVGSASQNQTLSERRANAVKAWLERKAPGDFPAGRVKAQGFGSTDPVASNDTDDGRAQNRRVDIVQRRAQ